MDLLPVPHEIERVTPWMPGVSDLSGLCWSRRWSSRLDGRGAHPPCIISRFARGQASLGNVIAGPLSGGADHLSLFRLVTDRPKNLPYRSGSGWRGLHCSQAQTRR